MIARNFPLTIVAAVASNGVIGCGNRLLWRLSSDLKRFKALTIGKPMIMGRKTFESIGKALPGRETIVITRDADFAFEGVHTVASVDGAVALGQKLARKMGATEIIVAGGGEIYALTMNLAQRLVMTHVELEPEGDAHFPPVDPAVWRQTERQIGVQGVNDEAPFSFAVYERVRNS